MPRTAEIVPLPADPKARAERKLEALWAEEDRLWNALVAVRKQIRPVQRQVSLDRGYLFTVSREKLSRGRKG